MRFMSFAAIAACICVAAVAAPISKDRALKVMKARHDGMHMIGDATKAIHRAQSGPDLPTIRLNAAKMLKLSKQAGGWFPLGTGPDVAKTRAKAEIWQNSDDFAAKVRNFQVAAKAFDDAARGNDAEAINARFSDLGGTCKACHDKYRSEEQH